jgi:hypothetical protein
MPRNIIIKLLERDRAQQERRRKRRKKKKGEREKTDKSL